MIGTKLKLLRNKRKYTIPQLCEKIGLNQNTYAKYERNERDVSTDILNKFADFYSVTTDYLLGRKSDETNVIKLPLNITADDLAMINFILSKYN